MNLHLVCVALFFVILVFFFVHVCVFPSWALDSLDF